MSNWFEEGKNELLKKIAEETRIEYGVVKTLYEEFAQYGFIDYDTEKEIIRGYLEGDEDE